MPIKISKADSDERLRQKVKEISGENFQRCYQCGTCSGSCPMTEQMTVLPRRVMALLQLGQKEALEELNTPWVCASCHLCMVRCPRGIDITRVMESLRQLKLRQNEDQINPSEIGREDIEKLPQIAMVSGFRKLTS
ncbi:MAG: heterodisulfide reductase [Candidatus Zixiibacteriota bacterium]|nr:MAG: heterodisulfide reductase [candidate division Zixibacteria bacterium]HHI02705.1 heterodisulfide reductase [candidate division Zixibacteria bacterium]